MRHPHDLLRRSIALCSGLVILTACDSSHTPVTPQPHAGSERLATASSGLVAFYPFDLGPGNGTVSGAVHRPTGGFQSGAYHFNGTAAYIDLPVNVDPTTMTQATMGAWVRIESVTPGRSAQVLSQDNGYFDRSIALDLRNLSAGIVDGRHHFGAFAGSGVLSGPAVVLNRWVFLAAVYGSGMVTLYVDGARYTTLRTPGSGVSFLRVGGNPAGSNTTEAFHGTIDNVFVYNRALSETEIATIRTGGACAIAAPCIGLPGAGPIRDGLGRIGELSGAAGTAQELTPSQSRHISKLLVTATGYLEQADRRASPQSQAFMLRYILVQLDEALGVLRGSGSATTAAREETLRVRTLVQAALAGA
jgi:hypothetical protein